MANTTSPLPSKFNLEDTGFQSILTDLINNTMIQTPTITEFTISTESSNIIRLSVQLKNNSSQSLGFVYSYYLYLSDSADGTDIVTTAPSGGVAAVTGVIDTITSNKSFMAVTSSTGLLEIDITETGADTLYLCAQQPNNRITVSSAIVFV